jgi:hypothetical protein
MPHMQSGQMYEWGELPLFVRCKGHATDFVLRQWLAYTDCSSEANTCYTMVHVMYHSDF